MERGTGAILLPDMQVHVKTLQEASDRVRGAQEFLFEQMRIASDAGMSLRAIAHNVGVNHERVRRGMAAEIEVKPF